MFVEGIIGPWFFGPWFKAVREGFDIRFVVLRSNEQTTVLRAIERRGTGTLVNPDVVRNMWKYLVDLGCFESYE